MLKFAFISIFFALILDTNANRVYIVDIFNNIVKQIV